MTLLELLLVMGLLATVFGAGLGVFAALDVDQRQAAGIVKESLRAAQNSALARQAPARVRIDAAAGTFVPELLVPVGTWTFERPAIPGQIPGAFGLDGRAEGALWIEDGFIGAALAFDAEGGWAEIPVLQDPAWDFTEGFALELSVRRDDIGGGRLLRIGATLGLDVGGAGELRGWLVPALEADGARPRPGGRRIVASGPGAVPPGRWVRLRMEYDRRRLLLSVDGLARARVEETRPVWRLDGPLVLSDEQLPFPGAVDDLVAFAVVRNEALQLPREVRLVGQTPATVRFAPDGTLDGQAHTEPVELVIEFPSGKRETITVGIYGTVE